MHMELVDSITPVVLLSPLSLLKEDENNIKVRVMLIGSSQLRRIGDEMVKNHGEDVEVVGCVRMGERTLWGNWKRR
jgi:hypothetical protein